MTPLLGRAQIPGTRTAPRSGARRALAAAVLVWASATPLAAQPASFAPEPPRDGLIHQQPLAGWRAAVLDLATETLVHPSWGLRHAERNYALAEELAEAEGMTVDDDVLFAAAYLHDWGGMAAVQVEGVPHEVRSIQLAEPFLRQAGFPMEKWPAVRDAILGHVPGGAPTTPEGMVLHDADLLDFLGAEGVARLLAATGDAPTMDRGLGWIADFADRLPDRLITAEARRRAAPRVAYMRGFLQQLRSELPPATEP